MSYRDKYTMKCLETIKSLLSCESYDCFENNRFQNSFMNGKVYHVGYRGLSIQQRPDIIYPFSILLNKIKPNIIIEIGTASGGLSLLLHDLTEEIESKIITYDIITPNYLKDIVDKNNLQRIEIVTKNIFSNDYITLNDTTIMDTILNKNNKLLILCDGGSKVSEFNIFSKFLKQDDILMAHDYAKDQTYFLEHIKNKIWNWHEIMDDNIIMNIQKYNLKPFMQEEFSSVAWGCFKK